MVLNLIGDFVPGPGLLSTMHVVYYKGRKYLNSYELKRVVNFGKGCAVIVGFPNDPLDVCIAVCGEDYVITESSIVHVVHLKAVRPLLGPTGRHLFAVVGIELIRKLAQKAVQVKTHDQMSDDDIDTIDTADSAIAVRVAKNSRRKTKKKALVQDIFPARKVTPAKRKLSSGSSAHTPPAKVPRKEFVLDDSSIDLESKSAGSMLHVNTAKIDKPKLCEDSAAGKGNAGVPAEGALMQRLLDEVQLMRIQVTRFS